MAVSSKVSEGLVKFLIFILSLLRVTLKKGSDMLKYLSYNQKKSSTLKFVWNPPKEIANPIFRTLDIQLTAPAVVDGFLHLTDANQESNSFSFSTKSDQKSENSAANYEQRYFFKETPSQSLAHTDKMPSERESHLENYLDQLMSYPQNPDPDQESISASESTASSGELELEFCPPVLPENFAVNHQRAVDLIARGPMVAIVNVDTSFNNQRQQDVLVF